jgi:hypothetical protein
VAKCVELPLGRELRKGRPLVVALLREPRDRLLVELEEDDRVTGFDESPTG